MKNDEYICDDRPIEVSKEIAEMTDEELEKRFQSIFGEYLNDSKTAP